MKGRFLVSSNKSLVEVNVYGDRSAVVLDWLLRVGVDKESFSIREVARDSGVSVGLVQRVFGALVLKGHLRSEGVRTSKKFFVKKPELILNGWLDHYSLVKKCRMWTYRTGHGGKEQVVDALKKSKLGRKVSLALHSAAEAYGCKNTNLQTLELYLLDTTVRGDLEKELRLEPQERGYEVLLIEPYYKSLLGKQEGLSPLLLTFIDLYHFPLRGREQADFMAMRTLELKRIFKEKA